MSNSSSNLNNVLVFQHFRNSSELDNKLQKILDSANQTASLTHSERKAVTDLSRYIYHTLVHTIIKCFCHYSLYAMQKKGEFERPCPIIKYIDDHQQNIQNTKQVKLYHQFLAYKIQ